MNKFNIILEDLRIALTAHNPADIYNFRIIRTVLFDGTISYELEFLSSSINNLSDVEDTFLNNIIFASSQIDLDRLLDSLSMADLWESLFITENGHSVCVDMAINFGWMDSLSNIQKSILRNWRKS